MSNVSRKLIMRNINPKRHVWSVCMKNANKWKSQGYSYSPMDSVRSWAELWTNGSFSTTFLLLLVLFIFHSSQVHHPSGPVVILIQPAWMIDGQKSSARCGGTIWLKSVSSSPGYKWSKYKRIIMATSKGSQSSCVSKRERQTVAFQYYWLPIWCGSDST